MSKKNIKDSIGYNPKPVHPSCMNCNHYRSDIEVRVNFSSTWTDEKNIRCGLYGFAVKKTAVCNEHQPKP
jgi:hypothetical protein